MTNTTLEHVDLAVQAPDRPAAMPCAPDHRVRAPQRRYHFRDGGQIEFDMLACAGISQ